MDVNGINIFYRDIGYGQTVILLHGYSQSSELFKRIDQHLAEQYRIILIDSRGHGQSEKNDEPYSIALMGKDVIAVMDKLGIKKATVIGFSDGGNIALQLAIDFPERLRKIIAISANARPEGILGSWRRLISIWKDTLQFFHLDTAMLSLLLEHPQLTNEQLSGITIPVMLIYGNRDIITKSHMQLLARLIPNCQMVIIKAGHSNIVKRWRRYERNIAEFTKLE
jgi:pimeloyl-ACP methyl ester carboxylesterase